MSARYGIKCTFCNQQTAMNFKTLFLADIIRLWTHFQILYEADSCFAGFEIKISDDYDEPYLMQFMTDHDGHNLIIINEYGDEFKSQ
jgi:hypothetical protein